MEAQHHRYSASSSEGWLNCPGKMSMEKDIPDRHSHYADEGSAAHFLSAYCLEKNLQVEGFFNESILCWVLEDGKEGQSFSSHPLPDGASIRSEWDVTEEMGGFIQEYLTLVREVSEDSYLFVEQRVDFGSFIGVAGAFGTSDTLIVSKDSKSLTIIDLKYGYTHVEAELNTQMMLYAAGTIAELDIICDFSRLETIRLIIAQPRVMRFPEWTISMGETFKGHRNIMDWFSHECKKAIAESELAARDVSKSPGEWSEEYLNPSPKGCAWCKAKSTCPALAKENLQAILATATATVDGLDDLDAIDAGDAPVGQDMVERATAMIPGLSFEKLAEAYALRPQIEVWVKAIESRMLSELNRGVRHPDWKLVYGRAGHLTWKSDEDVEGLIKACGLDKNDLLDKRFITPTAAKKVFKKNAKVLVQIDERTRRNPKTVQVAPATDSRPSINPFDDLENLPDHSNHIPVTVGEIFAR